MKLSWNDAHAQHATSWRMLKAHALYDCDDSIEVITKQIYVLLECSNKHFDNSYLLTLRTP